VLIQDQQTSLQQAWNQNDPEGRENRRITIEKKMNDMKSMQVWKFSK
jgi:hypothetical protein